MDGAFVFFFLRVVSCSKKRQGMVYAADKSGVNDVRVNNRTVLRVKGGFDIRNHDL